MSRYLTVNEASEILRISESLVYSEIRNGRMSHVRVADGTIRIAEEHLQAYLDAREVLACNSTVNGRTASRPRRKNSMFRHLDVSRLPARRK